MTTEERSRRRRSSSLQIRWGGERGAARRNVYTEGGKNLRDWMEAQKGSEIFSSLLCSHFGDAMSMGIQQFITTHFQAKACFVCVRGMAAYRRRLRAFAGRIRRNAEACRTTTRDEHPLRCNSSSGAPSRAPSSTRKPASAMCTRCEEKAPGRTSLMFPGSSRQR